MSNNRQSKHWFRQRHRGGAPAGVSRSAVSRTFTPGSSVSDETRQSARRRRGAELPRQPSGARPLQGGQPPGVYSRRQPVVSLISRSLLEHLTRRLHKAGRAVMVINTDDGEASAQRSVAKTLNYRSTATIVLSGKPPGSLIERCLQSGQQVILIAWDSFPCGQYRHRLQFDDERSL
jgi:DNA-binding LacI/PurR family transcriptional regulator